GQHLGRQYRDGIPRKEVVRSWLLPASSVTQLEKHPDGHFTFAGSGTMLIPSSVFGFASGKRAQYESTRYHHSKSLLSCARRQRPGDGGVRQPYSQVRGERGLAKGRALPEDYVPPPDVEKAGELLPD